MLQFITPARAGPFPSVTATVPSLLEVICTPPIEGNGAGRLDTFLLSPDGSRPDTFFRP